MRFTPLFDPYLPASNVPAFEKVKAKGENPGYNYKFIDFHSSNISGIPLHFNGWTVVTPIYKTTLYCDVCELPVQETKMHGKTRELHVDKFLELASDEKSKQELERSDQVVFKELNKYVNFNSVYKLQCGRCGRWIGKGTSHGECLDEVYGVCKYCANTMRKILE